MANIPPLKKVLPTSPDQIQKFSSEGEAALARMAHLNRAALYIGNEIATDEVSFTTDNFLLLSKPCGIVTIDDLGISPGGRESFDLVFNEALYTTPTGVSTPAFVQLTLGSFDDGMPVLEILTASALIDGKVGVRVNNIATTGDIDTLSFFYTVIPQLS